MNTNASTPQQPINAADLPALGQPLAGGTLVTLYWLNGTEYALVAMPANTEINGAWGEYGRDIATTHGDGESNTRAMAEAGSEIAKQARALDTFIPSAMESHLLMHAKESGVIGDLREDRWYWTSSQCSADGAYNLDFEGGWQDIDLKYDERLVRPVRKIPVLR
nr:hypothetical protein [uncultured Pseudomonas sp.]